MEEIKYQAIWGRLYLLLGTLFGLLFIFGALLLNDYTIFINLIAAIIVSYTGYSMLKKPYIHYNDRKIVVYSLFGSIRNKYTFDKRELILVKGERLYLGRKKLKLNRWMIDKKEWERMKNFYDDREVIINELQD